MDFEGKCCIVTGSAMGIGKAVAEGLLERGAKCVLADINWRVGEETAKDLGRRHGKDNVAYRRVDVSSANSVQEAFDFCVDTFGGVDVVVNNAGINGESNWESMLDINLKGVIAGTNAGVRYMGRNGKSNPGSSARNGGVVLNVSSIQGLVCWPVMPAYSAAKAGVVAFSRCSGHKMHYDVHGVRILCYCCNAVKTPIEDYFNYIGMSDGGHEYIKTLDKSNQLSAEEAAKGIIKVLDTADSGSVWYHHKSGDDPWQLDKAGTLSPESASQPDTWDYLLQNKP